MFIASAFIIFGLQIAEGDFRIAERLGLYVLVAILPQTIHDLIVLQSMFGFMEKVYGSATDLRSFMIDIGLVPCICKAFVRFYYRWGSTNDEAVQTMQRLATTIAMKSVLGAGTINVSQFYFVCGDVQYDLFV